MTHRIFGSELSPYSVKVRSYFRYKGLAHDWLLRSPANQAEFQKYAKLPLVPLVVTPQGEGVQDSTPIIERFETANGEPSIVPGEPALAFLSALLEEYGDEWGNKWMFHYRWTYQPDCWSTAERIAQQMMGAQGTLVVAEARAAVAVRMSGRLGFVGSPRFAEGGITPKTGWHPCVESFGIASGTARVTDVIVAPVGGEERGVDHPAMFPLALAEQLIKTFSTEGDLVLDPFCGSGQTLLAAKGCGRRYMGMEREDRFVKIALGRLGR